MVILWVDVLCCEWFYVDQRFIVLYIDNEITINNVDVAVATKTMDWTFLHKDLDQG